MGYLGFQSWRPAPGVIWWIHRLSPWSDLLGDWHLAFGSTRGPFLSPGKGPEKPMASGYSHFMSFWWFVAKFWLVLVVNGKSTKHHKNDQIKHSLRFRTTLLGLRGVQAVVSKKPKWLGIPEGIPRGQLPAVVHSKFRWGHWSFCKGTNVVLR